MAKDPAFPFYAQDFLIDTLRWDRDLKSLHVDLLAESWINGPLVDEQGFPFGLNSVDQRLWLRINHKWKLVNGFWINEKLEEIREERQAFKKRQSDKGKKSAETRKNKGVYDDFEEKKDLNHGSTMDSIGFNRGSTVVEPIEEEDEKEKEKENEIEEENKKEKKVIELKTDSPSKIFRECEEYISKYGKEMIDNFLGYWSEKNSRGRERWQLEKTWETSKRLVTWFNRSQQFQKEKGFSKNESKAQIQNLTDDELHAKYKIA